MKEISISTGKRVDLIDITAKIERIVRESAVKDGICHIFVPHTTAGVLLNENADPSVRSDIIKGLENMVPDAGGYTHAEGNSPAHIKSSIIGHTVTVPVKDGLLYLGTWQGIYFCEFDGPRTRKTVVTVQNS